MKLIALKPVPGPLARLNIQRERGVLLYIVKTKIIQNVEIHKLLYNADCSRICVFFFKY